jgi:hypothetical protein
MEPIGIDNNFLYRTRVVQQLKERISKWGYMKPKSSAQKRKQSPN